MLIYILAAAAAIVIIFLIVAAMQPDTFTVTRSTTIKAPPREVFPQVNNLRNWDAWSPWAKMDPEMEQTYDGPAAGPGATSAWKGNAKVGEGSRTITESLADQLIRIKLNFIRPFACSNDVEFIFRPTAEGTHVTWSMTGYNKFINKAVCLVMNMDKMVGRQFDEGLASMKAIVEGTSATVEPQADVTMGDNLAEV